MCRHWKGREDTLADLLQAARKVLARGDLAAAASQIHRVQQADPGHVDLPDALAELARQTNKRHRQAAEDLRRGRLPAALEGYRGLLAANPEDSEAERGVSQVADAYAARSEKLASDFRFEEAQAALREAEAIAPDAASVGEARRHMARSRQSQQRYGSSLPPAERQRRLQQMLDDAVAAEARGDLLTPPGDSAYDKLRVARSMAPAMRGCRRPPCACCPRPSAVSKPSCAPIGSAAPAPASIAWQVLEGPSAVHADAQRRLAQRWIAVGYERLGAGELQAATPR
jgi:tetratricopeptide (TPR) repeat protein